MVARLNLPRPAPEVGEDGVPARREVDEAADLVGPGYLDDQVLR